jgi:hypothetical protein
MFKKLDCTCLPSCNDVTYRVVSFNTDFEARHLSINPL